MYAMGSRATQTDSLLRVLDIAVDESQSYEDAKISSINQIRVWLQNPLLTTDMEYKFNSQMYEAYESYVCDSAWHYINRNIEIAPDNQSAYESKLRKAHILATGGLYAESEALLRTIHASALADDDSRAYFYKTMSDVYLYQTENNEDNEYFYVYDNLCHVYSDSALMYARKGSYLEIITLAPELAKSGKLSESIELLEKSIPTFPIDSHERSVMYSLMSFAYYCRQDREMQKKYLIFSAISDIHSVVMENRALREISEMLYAEGDIERANRYLKKSLSDATKFNSRLRNMQSSRMLPVIDAAYQKEQEQQRSTLKTYMWIISALSVLVLLAMCYIYHQMRRLSAANERFRQLNADLNALNARLVTINDDMQQTNRQLSESNHIKEEYVGRFMELCTTYIAEFDTFRKKLHKASGSTKISELQRMLSSDESVEAILREFYKTFDSSFLSLFPDFVERVNMLLTDDGKIELKSAERFNTEVRILSLIRLGINDSEKIASFLRCSITTIYTYRSKMKNRSLSPDDFEKQVMAIGTGRE